MRVCVVTTAFPRRPGDSEGTFVWGSVQAIARRGVQVRVVAMHIPGTKQVDVWNGIQVIRPRYWWPEQCEILRREGGGLPITLRKYPLARVQLLPFLLVHALAAARLAHSCDLIHAHWTLSAGAACLGRWFHHRPILVTVQGSDIFQVTRHPVGAWLTKKVLSRCNLITALSRALCKKVIELGIDPERIRVIPNGVDTDRFTPPKENDRDDIILFVGSLIERKGVKYLLGAMPAVLRSFPHYRLVIIGEGPQSQPLRDLTSKLGIERQVTFTGPLPQEEVRTWMQKAKVLVLPSLEEGMGVVLVEALACGTPVVASRVGGIQDVITPEVGILVPPADSAALSDGIQNILHDTARWKTLSRNARERAEAHYNWDRIAEQFVELYHSLV